MENQDNQQISETQAAFHASKMVDELFSCLSAREVEILKMRFGLEGEKKKTLEEIGQNYKITRERVRQVERNALNSIKNCSVFNDVLGNLIAHLKTELEHHGGIRSEELVLDEVLALSVDKNSREENCLRFIIRCLLSGIIDIIKTEHLKPSLILGALYQELFDAVLGDVVMVLEEEGVPLDIDRLKGKIKDRDVCKSCDHFIDDASSEINEDKLKRWMESYMHASHKVKRNPFGAWGLKNWKSITPKRMNEKIYLVLAKQGKPTHYKEITDLINGAGFDRKKAHSPTIHNELISDQRFVLVGRGIYALKEWGFKEGVVADVLFNLIKDKGEAMSRDELVDGVLKQRMVQKNTVYIALADKNRFRKLEGGRYSIILEG